MELSIENYARRTGKRMFLRPNLLARQTGVPPEPEGERSQPVRFGYRFADADTAAFVIPSGYVVEAFPDPLTLQSDFGQFASRTEGMEEGTLLYTRYLELV